MGQCGSVWVGVDGLMWLELGQYGSMWVSVGQFGSVWVSVGGCIWYSMTLCGSV